MTVFLSIIISLAIGVIAGAIIAYFVIRNNPKFLNIEALVKKVKDNPKFADLKKKIEDILK